MSQSIVRKLSDDELRNASEVDGLDDRLFRHFEAIESEEECCDWIDISQEADRVLNIVDGGDPEPDRRLISAMVAAAAAASGWESAVRLMAMIIGCPAKDLEDALQNYLDGDLPVDMEFPVPEIKAWVAYVAGSPVSLRWLSEHPGEGSGVGEERPF